MYLHLTDTLQANIKLGNTTTGKISTSTRVSAYSLLRIYVNNKHMKNRNQKTETEN